MHFPRFVAGGRLRDADFGKIEDAASKGSATGPASGVSHAREATRPNADGVLTVVADGECVSASGGGAVFRMNQGTVRELAPAKAAEGKAGG